MTDERMTQGDVRLREELESAADAIWDAMDDHGHNGLDCRPEKPMDYTAAHILDALAPVVERIVAARVGEAQRKAWDGAHRGLCEYAHMGCMLHDNPHAALRAADAPLSDQERGGGRGGPGGRGEG